MTACDGARISRFSPARMIFWTFEVVQKLQKFQCPTEVTCARKSPPLRMRPQFDIKIFGVFGRLQMSIISSSNADTRRTTLPRCCTWPRHAPRCSISVTLRYGGRDAQHGPRCTAWILVHLGPCLLQHLESTLYISDSRWVNVPKLTCSLSMQVYILKIVTSQRPDYVLITY
jgi:hypothetical protein